MFRRAIYWLTMAVVITGVVVGATRWFGRAELPPASDAVHAEPAADAYEVIDVVAGSTISGVVTLDVSDAIRRTLADASVAEASGEHHAPPASRAAAGGGLPDAVVQLVDIHQGRAFDASADEAVLNQQAMQFVPAVLLVRRGGILEMRNSDPASHNVRGELVETREPLFNYAMPLQNQRIRERLVESGTVKLSCDMKHGWMKATVVVMRHPYYAITDPHGHFHLSDVPAGTYRIRAWHEGFGERVQSISVQPNHAAEVSFRFSLS